MAYKVRRRLQKVKAVVGARGGVNLLPYPTRPVGTPLRGGPRMRLASRPLASRSYTATVTKQKKMHQKAIPQGQSGTFSYFNYGQRYRPRIMKSIKGALAVHTKVLNGASTISSDVGVQNYNNMISMYTVTDIKDMADDIDSSTLRKICHLSCKGRVLMTNQDNGVARIILYDIVARRDAVNDNYESPAAAWYNGGITLGTSGYIPGATPYAVQGFTQNFKILKTTHIQLAPGQLHEHRISFKPRKILDTNIAFVSDHDSIRGFTCFTVIVLCGSPSNDTVNNSQISLGNSKVDFVYTKEYKYVYLDKSVPTYKGTNSLPTAFTNAEQYMNIAKGEAVTSAQA